MGREGTQIDTYVDNQGQPLVLPPFTPVSQNIWIGQRTVPFGRSAPSPGTGSYDSPFAGNTKELLDTKLRTRPPNAIINFRDGEFETDGMKDNPTAENKGFRPKPYTTYRGIGMGKTILKLKSLKAAAPGNFEYEGAIFGDPGATTDMSGVVVEDMTLDSNGPNLGDHADGNKWRAGGAGLLGSHTRLRRVECINGRGIYSAGLEVFQLSMGGFAGSQIVDAIIEDCVVRSPDPASDYGYAAGIFDCLAGCKIQHNYFQDWGGTCCAGGLGTGLEIIHNVFKNARLALYIETNNGIRDTIGLRIAHNTAYCGNGNTARNFGGECGFLLLFGGAASGNKARDIALEDNTIYLLPKVTDGGGVNCLFSALGDVGSSFDFAFKGNRMFKDRAFAGTWPGYVAWSLGNVAGVEVSDNKYEIAGEMSHVNATGVKIDEPASAGGNTTLLGALRVKAIKGTGGSFVTQLPAAYVIAAGDRLQYEIYSDPSNPKHAPAVYFTDAGGPVNMQNLVDQNGLRQYGDIEVWAKGKWYFRDFLLTDSATAVTTRLNAGFLLTDAGGILNPNGAYKFYLRNIRVVDSAGALKVAYYTPESAVVSDGDANTNCTSAGAIGNWHPRISVTDITEYADNAAATAAGLKVGQLYRTVDAVKIVH